MNQSSENLSNTPKFNKYSFLLFAIGLIIYHSLFWKELLGVNLLLFNIIINITFYFLRKDDYLRKQALITGISATLMAVTLVINGSLISIISYIISFVIWIGFLCHSDLKTIITALPTGIYNFIYSVVTIPSHAKSLKHNSSKQKNIVRNFKLAIIPIIVLIIFVVIFKNANPVFSDYIDSFFNSQSKHATHFFDEINFLWVLFMIGGVILISGILFNSKLSLFNSFDTNGKDTLIRNRKKSEIDFGYSIKTIGLKDEFKTAFLIIILVNIALVIENIIDINWIWINFKLTGEKSYAQLVHEGTYLLILSILLSMAILLYYFRKNQNFYKNKKWLQYGAYFWIFQNMILVASVAIRNYRYIEHCGIAYKRIGVIFFLILTIYGLITLYFKIRDIKTPYYLLRKNSWAAYFIFIFLSLFNWDLIIVKNNVAMKSMVDVDKELLITLSDKTLPVLKNNIAKFTNCGVTTTNYFEENQIGVDHSEYIKYRIIAFKAEYKSRSFLSWNYADYKAYQEINK